MLTTEQLTVIREHLNANGHGRIAETLRRHIEEQATEIARLSGPEIHIGERIEITPCVFTVPWWVIARQSVAGAFAGTAEEAQAAATAEVARLTRKGSK